MPSKGPSVDKLLGIDLGTTGCKGSVYSADGKLLGLSYLECPLITLSPTMIEQDAHSWWEQTVEAIRLALVRAGVDGREIRGISISSQGISFVPLDDQGQPLSNAINWLDGRATEEAREILSRYPAKMLFAMTGKRAAPFYVLPKLLWLRRHQPRLFDRARMFLMGHDYIVYRLSGRYVTDHSMAGGTLLYDLARLGWSEELLEAFDIPVEKLPEIRWAGTPLGPILPTVARELGLSEETVVVVGGQDQKVAALGAGIREGVATVSLGTATAISVITEKPAIDEQMRIPAFTFVIPQRWDLEGVIGTGGGSLRWYRETFFPGEDYSTLDALAEQAPPGANGVFFYPHLTGAGSPHWQEAARAGFQGISLSTTRADMTRSVLEGVAFQIQENIEALEDIAGPIAELVLFGGGAKSALWWGIIADVTRKVVVRAKTVETANLGACILAGVGFGLFADPKSAQAAMIADLQHRVPEMVNVQRYESVYQEYREMETRILSG